MNSLMPWSLPAIGDNLKRYRSRDAGCGRRDILYFFGFQIALNGMNKEQQYASMVGNDTLANAEDHLQQLIGRHAQLSQSALGRVRQFEIGGAVSGASGVVVAQRLDRRPIVTQLLNALPQKQPDERFFSAPATDPGARFQPAP